MVRVCLVSFHASNFILSLTALPPPLVTTSSSGSSLAGSMYSLVCTVKVVDGLVVVPNVVWMKDTRPLVNGVNATLTRTMSGGSTALNLIFSPLRTSHGGQYTCVATISVPQIMLTTQTTSSPVTLSVQSKLINQYAWYQLQYLIPFPLEHYCS